MDYLKPVQNALEYIEQNLTQNIHSEDVAREAAVSKFHFHRIFLALAGNSVAGYIRRRRLTEAAYELIQTQKKIIDMALDYQFGTPESFSRAFKNMYGVNPGQYRSGKGHFAARHQPPIQRNVLSNLKARRIMEPKIITKNEFKVIGMRYFGDNQKNEIKQLWDAFLPEEENIKNRVNPTIGYGICYPVEGPDSVSAFEYLAAVEVSTLDEIAEGMVGRTIPAQKYAVFSHKGSVDKIGDTYQAIYAIWQPKSGYELIKAPDFEYYDERFRPDQPEISELDIYIPVQGKS
ncbi:MAG: helix-turn-helix domain-containing protein [Desulfobacteraceae bacterium]|nr:helix-turn-helix domain-containing protein [Desulfobacteraceae bacterium]MBU4055197.1 effector binding domain-containing protein [Pseudomonadota bacterium]